jgi:uncharacterized damage-inducible protein DinB
MPEDKEQLLRHYRESRKRLMAAIDGLTDDEMSQPSIDGWSVKDHLAHIAMWDEIRAAEVERISAGYESGWRMTDEQDEALNASGYEMRRSLSAAQAKWEFENSGRKLLESITRCTPRALDPSLYGAAGLRSGHVDQHAEWLERWRAERRG